MIHSLYNSIMGYFERKPTTKQVELTRREVFLHAVICSNLPVPVEKNYFNRHILQGMDFFFFCDYYNLEFSIEDDSISGRTFYHFSFKA